MVQWLVEGMALEQESYNSAEVLGAHTVRVREVLFVLSG